MTEKDIKRIIVPTAVLQDWLEFNHFQPGTYLTLASDDPEKTLVLYIRI